MGASTNAPAWFGEGDAATIHMGTTYGWLLDDPPDGAGDAIDTPNVGETPDPATLISEAH